MEISGGQTPGLGISADSIPPAPPQLTAGVWFFNTMSGPSKLLDGTLSESNGNILSPTGRRFMSVILALILVDH